MVMRFAICFIIFAVALPALAIDRLTASVDKNPVLVGEYFTLTIEANGKVSGQMPDTSAIAQNFITGPVSTSSRTQIINGSMSSATSWQMQVMSRSAGEFTIPAFEISGAKSQPINLRVVAREADDSQQKDVFVTTELNPQSLYVQQAALYTVKLFIGKDLLEAQMTPPSMEDGSITAMGQQEENYEVLDGRRYRVITREYLIQPQKSGSYTIEGPIFNGQVREEYRRMAVSAVGDSIDVEIKPIPDNYRGAWLPSELVNLAEEWQPEDNQVVVGSPITRTFTLTALGITKEQLPDIEVPSVDGFRIYPDETDRNQMARDGRVISQMVASYALLPQKPGTYTLPELKLPWFNTVINRVQYATLPARTIEVVADPNQPQQPIAQSQPSMVSQTPAQQSITDPQIVYKEAEKSWLDWGLMGLGYLLWFVTLALWLLKKPAKPVAVPSSGSEVAANTDVTVRLKQLGKAAKQGDNSQFYTLLRQYVELAFDQTLKSWLDQQSPEIREQIAKLQACLYSANKQQVDLVALYNQVCKIKKRSKSDTKNSLEKLY
ncbi:BatD family protein [Pseudoalteromonas sp. Of7M-16]|uniref:BatD family protein n=1 Tax=Pseudoalteromonas sp. Of7M-16 TaxID=2917756 RepID=UPI001EF65675|nr:BatD family protein [Pseudoalteromonas sp. Of7M-16]MCG7547770.1 BatD family protein [Pseudoalteromonas sp. Of7M-16]